MSIPNLLAIARLILTPVAMALILTGTDSQGTRIAATIVLDDPPSVPRTSGDV